MAALDDEIARLTRRLRAEPRSTVFVGLADALRRAGRHPEALQALREGFRAFPDHGPARVVLARVHLDAGRRDLAEQVLDEVCRHGGENLMALSLLARLRLEDGRAKEALPLVERLRALAPDDPAVALADRAAPPPAVPRSEDPFDAPALAASFARRGHYDRAAALWRRLDAAHPGDPTVRDALRALDRSLAGQGDAPGEPPLPEGATRRPLPGIEDAVAALGDDVDAPPEGAGPVERWARLFWRSG